MSSVYGTCFDPIFTDGFAGNLPCQQIEETVDRKGSEIISSLFGSSITGDFSEDESVKLMGKCTYEFFAKFRMLLNEQQIDENDLRFPFQEIKEDIISFKELEKINPTDFKNSLNKKMHDLAIKRLGKYGYKYFGDFSLNNSDVEFFGGNTFRVNCFWFALPSLGIPLECVFNEGVLSFNAEKLEKLIDYYQVNEPVSGDLVAFFDETSKTMNPNHYAIWTEEKTVVGKLGDDGIYEHPLDKTLSSYGSFVRFYHTDIRTPLQREITEFASTMCGISPLIGWGVLREVTAFDGLVTFEPRRRHTACIYDEVYQCRIKDKICELFKELFETFGEGIKEISREGALNMLIEKIKQATAETPIYLSNGAWKEQYLRRQGLTI